MYYIARRYKHETINHRGLYKWKLSRVYAMLLLLLVLCITYYIRAYYIYFYISLFWV